MPPDVGVRRNTSSAAVIDTEATVDTKIAAKKTKANVDMTVATRDTKRQGGGKLELSTGKGKEGFLALRVARVVEIFCLDHLCSGNLPY